MVSARERVISFNASVFIVLPQDRQVQMGAPVKPLFVIKKKKT